MRQVSLEEAAGQLAPLIEQAQKEGEDGVIVLDRQPVARLVPVVKRHGRPRAGTGRGLIQMAEDFDAPLEDFRNYQ